MTNENLNLIHSLSGLDWKYTIGLVSVAVGAVAKLPSLMNDYKERVHRIKAARLEWLHAALKEGQQIRSPAMFKELVMSQATGYAYTSDEIDFATASPNPMSVLHDIRYGKPFVEKNDAKDGYSPKAGFPWMKLKTRQNFTEVCGVIFGILSVSCLLAAFVTPLAGLLVGMEFAVGTWLMADASRGLSCARRLCSLNKQELFVPINQSIDKVV